MYVNSIMMTTQKITSLQNRFMCRKGAAEDLPGLSALLEHCSQQKISEIVTFLLTSFFFLFRACLFSLLFSTKNPCLAIKLGAIVKSQW